MNEQNKIWEELKEISNVLASVEKKNVFTVPENYFDNLAERICLHTLLNENKKTQDENLQQVPTGYFDTLSSQILTKIKREEAENAEEESTLLSSLKDKNVFKVPEGYFNNLSENIISKIDRPAAKVVSISSAKRWWKYAAAAVVTSAIAVNSLQIFYKSPDMTKHNTAAQSNDLPDYIQSSFQYKTAQQIDEGIASLSPDEIAKYLENNGNILDDEILSSDVDPNDLPSEIDYLSDENTLNKYLNSLNASGADK